MKKITLAVCLLIIAFANAQDEDNQTSDKLTFEKGRMLINGNLSLDFGSGTYNSPSGIRENKQFGFSVNPSFAYAIRKNLFLGLGVGYGHFKVKNELNSLGTISRDTTTNTRYSVFPYVRYYKAIGKKVGVFLQGEGRYTYIEGKYGVSNSSNTNQLFVGIRPGIIIMVTDKLAMESSIGALGYTHSKNKNDTNSSRRSENDSFSLSLNSTNLFFGLSYYL